MKSKLTGQIWQIKKKDNELVIMSKEEGKTKVVFPVNIENELESYLNLVESSLNLFKNIIPINEDAKITIPYYKEFNRYTVKEIDFFSVHFDTNRPELFIAHEITYQDKISVGGVFNFQEFKEYYETLKKYAI